MHQLLLILSAQKIEVCFLSLGGEGYLELIEGLDESPPVNKILEGAGGGVYHACYQVKSIDSAIAYSKKHGFLLITRFEELDNPEFRYAFLLTHDRHVFELCELLVAKNI